MTEVKKNKRRDFLQLSSITIGAVGTAAFIWPFLKSMNPAEDTLALGSTEVDISEISGSETFLHLHNENVKCVATLEEVKTYEVNEKIKINFDLSKIYLFKESGELQHSPYKN